MTAFFFSSLPPPFSFLLSTLPSSLTLSLNLSFPSFFSLELKSYYNLYVQETVCVQRHLAVLTEEDCLHVGLLLKGAVWELRHLFLPEASSEVPTIQWPWPSKLSCSLELATSVILCRRAEPCSDIMVTQRSCMKSRKVSLSLLACILRC